MIKHGGTNWHPLYLAERARANEYHDALLSIRQLTEKAIGEDDEFDPYAVVEILHAAGFTLNGI